ncbi:hypothetical protein LCGC14_1157700 [marine sediment metagenome]|uniref:Uncharacterized protein n=1 Tax=marine sediment metagenome TaxID=412755 RepID=A0A0F9LTN5_9ZZZZ
MANTGESCALCGARHQDAGSALVHKLVAHGPLVGASPRKRKRVRTLLPRFGNSLERAGFGEVEAHIILRLLAEELRNAGLA